MCRCSALLITGQHSIFNASTRSLHQAITKTCSDKTKVEFIEVIGVANVVEEKVDACSYCLLCLAIQSGSKKWYPGINFAITSVNVHRF